MHLLADLLCCTWKQDECCDLLLPLLYCRASSFKEAMRMGSEVYHNLKSLIKEKYGK